MARQARDRSTLKVYHAILRGVNKQQIFECQEDYEHFVRILQRQCGLPVETRPTRVQPPRYTLKANEQKYNAPTTMVSESDPEEDLWQTYFAEDDFLPYPGY